MALTLTPEEEAVLEALLDHRGRDHGIGGRELGLKLAVRNRLLRQTIESLIVRHGIPVGADPDRGYYLIESDDEFGRARAELVSRIRALGRRLRALTRAHIGRQVAAQPPLPFEEIERCA